MIKVHKLNEATTDAISQRCRYLFSTAVQYVNHDSGLKKEHQTLAYGAYCVALDHVLLACGIKELDKDASVAEERIAKHFEHGS